MSERGTSGATGRAVAGGAAAVGRAVVGVVRDFLGHVIVEPVRRGRLRSRRWPRGLAPVVVVALAGYAIAVAAILAAAPLRAASELTGTVGVVDLSIPQVVVGPVLALVVLALSLAQTAALHTPLWLTVALTAMTVLVLLSVGATDAPIGGIPSVGRVVSALAALVLVVLVIVRRRRSFAWGEFVVTFAAMALGIGVPAWFVGRRSWQFGLETGPIVLTSMMQSIGTLAIPAALAAGAAVAQLSCSMATESVGSARRHLPISVLVALLGVLVLWRTWAVVDGFVRGEGTSVAAFVAAIVLLGLVAAAWLLVARLRPHAPSPTAAELEARFSALAQPLAAWLIIGIVPSTLLLMLSGTVFAYTFAEGPVAALSAMADLITQRGAIWGSRLVVGVVLITLAVRDARRDRRVTPELYAAIGVVVASASVLALAGLDSWSWSGRALTVVVTIAAIALLGWWATRRRLTAGRGAALGMVLLIAALFDQRTFVEDPLRAVFGFTGIAIILFGFVWAMLTGAESANGSSRRYPRAGRVLLFLANALFGVTVLAVAALARDPAATIDLGVATGLGDRLLGTGLLAAALLACLALAIAPAGPPPSAHPDAAEKDAAAGPHP